MESTQRNIDINNFVVSSRVRLARNVNGFNFPCKLENNQAYVLMKTVSDVVGNGGNFAMHIMAHMSEIERAAYVERHLISPALAQSDRIGGVIVSSDEKISIMLNEEDHIRAQCIESGFNLPLAFGSINKIDDRINQSLDIAYDGVLGFLTCCPTNTGTGMRASVMAFLPMLTTYNEMNNVAAALSGKYITVRGHYGEGSQASGYMYQISNQASLGVSEEEIVIAVSNTAVAVCNEELKILEAHYARDKVKSTDTAHRAKALLTNAYVLSSFEFMDFFVGLKLGITLGLVNCRDLTRLNKLPEQVLPNNLLLSSGKNLNETERDIYRAEFVKKTLNEILA